MATRDWAKLVRRQILSVKSAHRRTARALQGPTLTAKEYDSFKHLVSDEWNHLARLSEHLRDAEIDEEEQECLLALIEDVEPMQMQMSSRIERLLNQLQSEPDHTDQQSLRGTEAHASLLDDLETRSIVSTSSSSDFNTVSNRSVSPVSARADPPSQNKDLLEAMTSVMRQAARDSARLERHAAIPPLPVATFDGDPMQWESFWDDFNTRVHQAPNLTPCDRMRHLKKCLKGSALQVMEKYPITAANYYIVIQELKDEYSKPRHVKVRLESQLEAIKRPSKDYESLNHFKHEVLGILLQMSDLFGDEYVEDRIRIVLDKLPPSLREKILLWRSGTEVTLNDLRKSLNLLIDVQEYETYLPSNKRSSHSTNSHSVSTTTPQTAPETAKVVSHSQSFPSTKVKVCALCQGPHFAGVCGTYPTREERRRKIQELKLCFRCLSSQHRVADCRSEKTCQHCGNFGHHTALCYRNEDRSLLAPTSQVTPTKYTGKPKTVGTNSKPRYQSKQKTKSNRKEFRPGDSLTHTTFVSSATVQKAPVLALPTATITLKGQHTRIVTRSLFDTGAQRTFVDERTFNQLGLKSDGTIDLTVNAFGSEPKMINCKTAKLTIELGGKFITLKVIVHPHCTTEMHVPGITNVARYLKSRGVWLADQYITSDQLSAIQVIIGTDGIKRLIHGLSQIDGIGIMNSPAGALIFGDIPQWAVPQSSSSISSQHVLVSCAPCLETPEVTRLWDLDAIGIHEKTYTPEEVAAIDRYETDVNFKDGYYEVPLPFRLEKIPPTNYRVAIAQLNSLQGRFKKEPKTLEAYNHILKEYEESHFIERVRGPITGHYLPHHPVEKTSSTTPIRIVFNASSHSPGSPSLNDCLYPGPSLTAKLVAVLTEFRFGKYALIADISKAFLRIAIPREQRDFVRFLWRPDPQQKEIITYRFRVVPFGTTCSPFLLQKTLEHHFEQHPSSHAKQLLKKFYVDNYSSTCEEEEELFALQRQVVNILAEAGMPMQQWNSNSDTFNVSVNNDRELEPTVLGLCWHTANDTLRIKDDPEIKTKGCLTKRRALSVVSSIFDPLGLVSPVVVLGKIFVQELWKGKLSWDTPLPPSDSEAFMKFVGVAQGVKDICFPRNVIYDDKAVLHIFCDASAKAFGAVAYVCSGGKSQLLTSKTRLAPIKEKTIPKLELTALLVGARLGHTLQGQLPGKFSTCYLWTDSQVALCWSTNNLSKDVYVRNRVKEISQYDYSLRYVPSGENPADILSKGMSANKLKNCSLWHYGPSWLTDGTWPNQPNTLVSTVTLLIPTEEREKPYLEDIVSVQRFSNFITYLRVFWLVLQAIAKFRGIKRPTIRDAWIWIFKLDQIKYYNDVREYLVNGGSANGDTKCLFKQLNLYLDDNSLICSKGRLLNATLPLSAKNPILLSRKSPLTELLVQHIHEINLHAGVSSTLVFLREEFWLPRARPCIKRILSHCYQCRRTVGKPLPIPSAPPLPKERVQLNRPFEHVACDYAGPITVTDPEERSVTKVYLCLFTCQATRAIHLELLTSLSANDFLCALRRFSARFSFPISLYTDNARQFKATSSFLRELQENPEVRNFLGQRAITWRTTTPNTPWMGGAVERMVGVVKRTLAKSIYLRQLTLEEMRTLIVEVETVINNRPLTYLSDDRFEEILTPNHLIYGRLVEMMPPLTKLGNSSNLSTPTGITLRKQYARLSTVLSHFQNSWRSAYLLALRERYSKSGSSKTCPLKVGDVVLVNLQGKPRYAWPIARVTRLIKGRDDIIRSAEILTRGQKYVRSVTHLVPMEIIP